MEKQRFIRNLILNLSGLAFAAKIPLFQGTIASGLACAIYYFFTSNLSFLIFVLVILVISFPLSEAAEKIYRRKDPKEIVIDDFLGMCIALLFVPQKISYIFICFVLFRIFDASKIYPANKIERLKGAWGIVGDDLVAGFYANLAFHLSWWIFRIISSKGV